MTKVEKLYDILDELNIEKLTDQEYRNEIIDALAELADDPNVITTMQNEVMEDTDAGRKLKKLFNGLAPIEMAATIASTAPQALFDKAANNITHVYQYFGSAGKGKTFTLNTVLEALNSLTFAIAKDLSDGKDANEIKKNTEKQFNLLFDIIEKSGIELDKDKFVDSFISSVSQFQEKISSNKQAAKQWNMTLSELVKNPEWNKLANIPDVSAKIGMIDTKKNIADLMAILPGAPFGIWNDMYQNLIDPGAVYNVLQALGEEYIPTSQFVVTSNNSPQAFNMLAETFGKNPGFKSRAGIFFNTSDANFVDLMTERYANRSFAHDNMAKIFLNDFIDYSENKKVSGLINQFLTEEGKNKLRNLANAIENISKEMGLDKKGFVKLFNSLVDNASADTYKKFSNVTKGSSLAMTILKSHFEKNNLDVAKFMDFQNAMKDIFFEELSLGTIVGKSGFNADAANELDDKVKNSLDLNDLIDAIKEDKDVGDLAKQLIDNVNELEIKGKNTDFMEEGKRLVNDLWNEINNAIKDAGENWKGRFIPDADLFKNAKEFEMEAQKNLDKIDSEAFMKLNHRGICNLREDNIIQLSEEATGLRHIKQTLSTLAFAKNIMDENSFKKFALRYTFGAFGINDVSKTILNVVGLTGKDVRKLRPEQMVDKFNDVMKLFNDDTNKFVDEFANLVDNLKTAALEENQLADIQALMDEFISTKFNKALDGLKNPDDDFYLNGMKEFESLGKFYEALEKFKEEDKLVDIMDKLAEKGEAYIDAFNDLVGRFEDIVENENIFENLPETYMNDLKNKFDEYKKEGCEKTDGNLVEKLKDSLTKSFNENNIKSPADLFAGYIFARGMNILTT